MAAMGIARIPLAAISLFFLFLSLLFMLFVVLSGTARSAPLDRTYFLQADTTLISGARGISQWNFFYICGRDNWNCGSPVPALPFGYAWAARPSFAPAELIGELGSGTTSSYYYYMWRFGWVFYLLSLIFTVVTFFAGFLAFFGRLGAAISGLITLITFVFYTLAVVLMSATFVKARNVFRASSRYAEIGSYAFGFSWSAWFFLIFALGLSFLGMKHHDDGGSRSATRRGWRTTKRGSPKSSTEIAKKRVKEEYA